MIDTIGHELLNRLHPLHCAFGEDGDLFFCSTRVSALFPDAKSIVDLFASNSAGELLDLVSELKSTSADCGVIDLFSIQLHTTWLGKLTRLDEQNRWLLCMETLDKKTVTEFVAEDMSREQILELQRKALFYEALLHQLPAEVAVFDPDFKFLFVNQNAIKNEELRRWLIGRSEIEYWKSKNLPLEKAIQRIEGFKKAVAEKKAAAVEEVFHAGTEKEKQYVRVTHPYFKEDELQFLLTYGIDITELKLTENKLMHQNNELEKVNAELDQFVYSASHNLRAPLLSMKGLLSLISLEDTAFEDRNRFMEEVYKSIERLDATIHDIIEYSKNARLDIAPQEIDILQIIHSTIEDLKFIDQSNVAFDVKTDLNTTLFSDERRIRSIIHNIVSNSIKYADTAKTDRFLHITANSSASHCMLTFTDNGIGIPQENQERVFDMFYRGTSMRTGSGLGLYIVKEMLNKLGGHLQLTSQKGIGTSITLEIPNLAPQVAP
jgi:signal transduction histidine kinase